jgi:repressor LexA
MKGLGAAMPEPLTQLERRIYQYMIDFLAENTYQPSIREIAKKFRIKSTKTVSDLLHSLSTKGYIERDQSRSRGVRILGFAAAGQVQPVPIYAKVNAAEPALLPELRQGYITMDRRFLPSDDVFFLKIQGDAMSRRGMLAGDYVLVSPSTRAKDGDAVAVRLGEETAVRTLQHRGMTLVLEPAAEGERAIEVGPRDNFAILGVVAGVFRPYFETAMTAASDELAIPALEHPASPVMPVLLS